MEKFLSREDMHHSKCKNSLGGAMVSWASGWVKAPWFLLYTFGMPRVANYVCALQHDKLVNNIWRVVNNNDAIRNFPSRYTSVGNTMQCGTNRGYRLIAPSDLISLVQFYSDRNKTIKKVRVRVKLLNFHGRKRKSFCRSQWRRNHPQSPQHHQWCFSSLAQKSALWKLIGGL